MSGPSPSPTITPSSAPASLTAFPSIEAAVSTDAAFPVSAIFGTALPLPDLPITTYDVDLQQLSYAAEVCCPEAVALQAFQPTISYFSPFSHGPDIAGALTPVSLQPAIEFSCGPASASLHVDTNVESFSPERPRSSPSTFGNTQQRLRTPDPHIRLRQGVNIQHAAQITPASSPSHTPSHSSASDTQLNGLPLRYYTPIAPNPAGLRQLQATKSSGGDDEVDSTPSKRRKLSAASSPGMSMEMTDEEQLLLRLKDEEQLTWKDIASRFQSDLGKSFQIPALQMRLKRLRERMRVWSDLDVQALRMAHDYWLSQKFEIIAAKMSDFGAPEKWSAKQCARKWQEIGFPTEPVFGQPLSHTPTFSTSYNSSPIDNPQSHYYPFVTSS